MLFAITAVVLVALAVLALSFALFFVCDRLFDFDPTLGMWIGAGTVIIGAALILL